jgi:hypothetical protein
MSEDLIVVNQDGIFRQLNLNGIDAKFGRCDICYRHSKSSDTKQWANIQINNGELSITEADYHLSCTPLSERQIAFQGFDRQCRKLIKENGLNPNFA